MKSLNITAHTIISFRRMWGEAYSSNIVRRLWFIMAFCVVNHYTAFTQDSSAINVHVNRVIIIGNEHTKDFVILREMTLKQGSLITQDQLEYDKNRIYSLGLFNEVKMMTIPSSENTADIVVQVIERWYIYPFPILGIKDRDWGKFYYGLGLLHMNFRGRNEKLVAMFVVGYDPSFALSYRNPFLMEDGSYFLDAFLGTNKIRNKDSLALKSSGGLLLTNFDERHYTFNLILGKRFGIAHTAWMSVGYEVIDVSPPYPHTTISSSGEDKIPKFGVGYSYDTRDVREFASLGTFASFTITKFGLPSGTVDVIRYAADARHYLPIISNTVATARVMMDFAEAGPTPSYNRVYFGYGERIRGHFREVHEGENRVGASTELHYTLLSPKYFTVDDLPQAFGVWRFGIVAAAFADAGTVWFRNQPFALNTFIKGYGIGLDFLLPYSAVLRAEFALNEVRKGEFILDLGSTF